MSPGPSLALLGILWRRRRRTGDEERKTALR
jgi:hypothetical protein